MNVAQAWAQGAHPHGLYLYTLTEQELHDCTGRLSLYD